MSLDTKLAYSRHYPAISWVDSYSEYSSYIGNWWSQNVGLGWTENRIQINEILAINDNLQNIVQLIGSENLPMEQQLIIFVAEIVKRSFLIQNAFDLIDRYCSPKKLLKMSEIILAFYEMGLDALKAGVPIFKIKELPQISLINRIRIDIDNTESEKIDDIRGAMREEYHQLVEPFW